MTRTPSRRRTSLIALVAGPLVAATLALSPTAAPSTPAARHGTQESAQVVLDWERILFRTVYTDAPTPVPTGVPILGFTSLAMYDAVNASQRRGRSSETAAVARAAHDVLLAYYPAAAPKLDADLATSLASVTDPLARQRGSRVGAAAAAAMLRSRVGDGYGDPTIHYVLPPGVGVWQPNPGSTDMLGAWIGSLRPLMVRPFSAAADGPDPLTSAAYAADYDEVRRLGSAASTDRTAEQTATALFFNSNSATTVSDALVRRLEASPIGLQKTARIFAEVHTAMTDSLIQCWRLKRDVGFWRPSQAVVAAADDGNPATQPEAGWTPLIPNPNYSDYVSGHGCLTAPAVQVIRSVLGEDTTLELRSVNGPPRVYTQLAHIEYEAFHARIWSGLHFRDAMVDAYVIGHDTAARVLRAMRRR